MRTLPAALAIVALFAAPGLADRSLVGSSIELISPGSVDAGYFTIRQSGVLPGQNGTFYVRAQVEAGCHGGEKNVHAVITGDQDSSLAFDLGFDYETAVSPRNWSLVKALF